MRRVRNKHFAKIADLNDFIKLVPEENIINISINGPTEIRYTLFYWEEEDMTQTNIELLEMLLERYIKEHGINRSDSVDDLLADIKAKQE